MKFYTCNPCDNVFTFLNGTAEAENCGIPEAAELIPGSVDAAAEKHVPVVTLGDKTVKVSVGSVAHPMISAHFITWVAVETNQGSQIKYLTPDTAPEVVFALAEGETVRAVYAYCNLHGLWKAAL